MILTGALFISILKDEHNGDNNGDDDGGGGPATKIGTIGNTASERAPGC